MAGERIAQGYCELEQYAIMVLMLAKLRTIVYRFHLPIALGILALMLGLSFFTLKNDSAVVDEVAHIPAGYSYLKYGDYRLNPEHPPLIKDIAAFPLLFLHLKFPDTIPAWTTDPNGQWEAGWNFIYHIGNNADSILLYSRLPILLLGLLLGFGIYKFCLRRYGPPTALMALTLYALSPNIIAHDHFVTTDLGIAAFIFFAVWSFLAWLKQPKSPKRIAIAVMFFALAQVAKFSAVMLVPFFGLLVAIKLATLGSKKEFKTAFWGYALGLAAIFGFGMFLVWIFYIPHTLHMPASMQDKLITSSLPSGYNNLYGKYLTQYNDIAILKPLIQYILGVLMVINRVQSGNVTYLLGDVTNQSFVWYFPVSFVFKTPLPMLILILATLGAGIVGYAHKTPLKVWSNFRSYAQDHFTELTCLLFIAYYSYLSITGNLNLGIRHLFPMMPFVFILVAKKSVDLYHNAGKPKHKQAVAIATGVLMSWYVIGAFLQFPAYLPYINEAFGGSSQASKYLSDSNVDWGQDAKRLATYINNNPDIDKIAVDYFGGADMHYYMCKRRYDKSGQLIRNASGYDCGGSKYIEWHVDYGKPHTKYIAVSETYLVSDLFYQKYRPRPYNYQWLRDKTPIKRIGDSIYIYKVQ